MFKLQDAAYCPIGVATTGVLNVAALSGGVVAIVTVLILLIITLVLVVTITKKIKCKGNLRIYLRLGCM